MFFPTRETHIPIDKCSWLGKTHISSHCDMCSRVRETHIPSDMCSWVDKTLIPSDMCSQAGVSPTWKHISLGICVFPYPGTHITRDMSFPYPRTHITRDMSFPYPGTYITRDMCFPYLGTHITRDMCFPYPGTHIIRDMCFFYLGTLITICSWVGETHIPSIFLPKGGLGNGLFNLTSAQSQERS